MCQINIEKMICFVDGNGRELFQLPDGGSIQLISDSGDRQMQKFAQRMAGDGIVFHPFGS